MRSSRVFSSFSDGAVFALCLISVFVLSLVFSSADQTVHASERFEGKPEVITLHESQLPSVIPVGTRSNCYRGTCVGLQWGGYTYWVFTESNNAHITTVAMYDSENKLIAYKRYSGLRYVETTITVDEEAETITMIGQSGLQRIFPWSDLYRMSTTEVTLEPNPLIFGEEVTMTARVIGLTSDFPGAVNFMSSNTKLNDAPLYPDADGIVTFTTSSLPPGHHHIVAEYSGDELLDNSISMERSLFIHMEPQATGPYVEYRSYEDRPDSYLTNASLFCMQLLPGGEEKVCPMIVWDDYEYWIYKRDTKGSNVYPYVVVAYDKNGVIIGYKSYEFNYDGSVPLDIVTDAENERVILRGQKAISTDSIYIPEIELLGLRGMLQATTTTLEVSPNPVTVTRKVTLRAEVSEEEERHPTGDVLFRSGELELGIAALEDGIAELVLTNLEVGTHQITAKYLGGNGYHEESVSSSVELIVEKKRVGSGPPRVVYMSPEEAPDHIPEGLRLECAHRLDGDELTYCPTIEWGDYVYWIFAEDPFRLSMAVYDQSGEFIRNHSYHHVFSLQDIMINETDETITLDGAVLNKTFSWSELYDILYSTTTTLTVEGAEWNDGYYYAEPTQSLTLTIKVVGPGPGMNLTGYVEFIENGFSHMPVQVGEDGTVELNTYIFNPGKHVYSARYFQDERFEASESTKIMIIAKPQAEAGVPYIEYLPLSAAPEEWPQNTHLRCHNDSFSFDDGLCPVIQYNGVNYWIFSEDHNDWATNVAGYDSNGKLLGSKWYEDARYIYDAVVFNFEFFEMIMLIGQSDRTITLPWTDLTDMLTATSTTIMVTPNPADRGQEITLTSVVNGYQPSLTGTVMFMSGEEELGSAEVDVDGRATLTVADLSIGVHEIYAVYSGDEMNDASTSERVSLHIRAEKPTAEFVTIHSTNALPYLAKVGDTVTVTFAAYEEFRNITVFIVDQAVTVQKLDTDDGLHTWAAHYVLGPDDPEGVVTFTLDFEDALGTAAVQVKETTDDSTVHYDKTAPLKAAWSASIEVLTNESVAVTILYPDDAVLRQYQVNNGDWQSYTAPVIMEQNGTIRAISTDEAGNESEMSEYVVSNIDRVRPELNLIGDSEIVLEVHTPYTDAGATAMDNVDAVEELTSRITVYNEVNISQLGTYYVRYFVTDQAGNQAEEVVRTVRVVDTTDPHITLKGTSPMFVAYGSSFVDPHATAEDNYDGDITADITVTGSVYTEQTGTYVITYRVTDSSGNTAIAERSVIVVDQDKPVINLKGPAYVQHEVGTPYEDLGATASDNADGDITSQIIVKGYVNEQVLGTYILQYIVSDSEGNEAIAIFRTVEVVDREAPQIILVGDNRVSIEQGQDYVDAGVTVTDNYDTDLTEAVVISGWVDSDTPGEYTLTYTVSDSSGNQAQVERTVYVFSQAVDDPDDVPGEDSGEQSGGDPGDVPDEDPGEQSGGDPEDVPGEDSGEQSDGDRAENPADDLGLSLGNGSNDRNSGDEFEQVEPEDEHDDANGLDILFNGRDVRAGFVISTEIHGRMATVVEIDEDKVGRLLDKEDDQAIVTIPAATDHPVAIFRLSGHIVKKMEIKQALVEMQTTLGTYRLPAEQIRIDEITDHFAQDVNLKHVYVQIEIAEPQSDGVSFAEHAIKDDGLMLVVPPVQFGVRVEYGDQFVDISRFQAYVERYIPVPEGTDPERITTGVAIEPDGTVRHVPTQIVYIDGAVFAKINSLNNSLYSVVWNEMAFTDVANHWSKNLVNEMGARLIVSGDEHGLFKPDQTITRAQFTAMLVRGLGLSVESDQQMPFEDVAEADWHHDVVLTAYAYELANGYEDGSFRPQWFLTREQAMVLITNAMKLTPKHAGYREGMDQADDEILQAFTDHIEVSEWAKRGVAAAIRAGFVSGDGQGRLAPGELATRAEAAVMIYHLLVHSDLIHHEKK